MLSDTFGTNSPAARTQAQEHLQSSNRVAWPNGVVGSYPELQAARKTHEASNRLTALPQLQAMQHPAPTQNGTTPDMTETPAQGASRVEMQGLGASCKPP